MLIEKELRTRPDILRWHEADTSLDPYSPRGQAIYEEQWKVCHGGAAVPLNLPRPYAAAHRS